jgi:ATP-binding cassette subfamily F protein 3
VISINKLSVSFGGTPLFDEINFHIGDKDKIGLVGKNGSGKSTILKIIAGINNPSSGEILRPSSVDIGYLPQQMDHAKDKSVFDEVMMAFSHITHLNKEMEDVSRELTQRTDYESSEYHKLIVKLNDVNDKLHLFESDNPAGEAEKTLLGLGFKRNEFSRSTSTLSQGWNMRIELAKILLKKPSVLLLDEPTNHLDIESIQWLEEYLSGFSGSLVLVSHDRRFLDKVTNRTVEIMLGRIHDYKVPYSKYLELRRERIDQQKAAYDNQQRMIEKSEEFIERFRYKATKSNQVQSRIKQLEKIDRIEIDLEDNSTLLVKFPPAPRSGQVVVKAKDLKMQFDSSTVVFEDVNFLIEKGEKVALLGRNGEGKTTFMRLLIDELNPTKGSVALGHNVSLGYYAQNQDDLLDKEDTVIDTLDKIAVGDIRTKLRDILAAFLFKGDEIDKKVGVLSGGERSRLAMAKLMLNPHNLLALDEPTNHMDIRSKDILKQALIKYDGTLVIVSHDRDFLDGLITKIYEFKDGGVREHLGGISEFLDRKKIENINELNLSNQTNIKPATKASDPVNYKEQKEAEKETRKRKYAIERCEKSIEELENKISAIEAGLAAGSFAEKMEAVLVEYANLKEELNDKMEEWERLQQ